MLFTYKGSNDNDGNNAGENCQDESKADKFREDHYSEGQKFEWRERI